jgi:hypothetical protein
MAELAALGEQLDRVAGEASVTGGIERPRRRDRLLAAPNANRISKLPCRKHGGQTAPAPSRSSAVGATITLSPGAWWKR